MILPEQLLKIKELTSTQKLILGLVMNECEFVMQLAGGYMKTCGDMANELGLNRKIVRKEFDDLVKKGYITTSYGTAWRKSNLTEKCEAFFNLNK